MKKLALLSLVAVLLAGCQPAATPTLAPTPAPVEALASSTSDLVGIWSFQNTYKLEFKADGTYRVSFGSGSNEDTIDLGNYTFDAGKITYATSTYCPDNHATYEIYITKQDGKPVSLRMKVVGSDSCVDRADISAGIGMFKNP